MILCCTVAQVQIEDLSMYNRKLSRALKVIVLDRIGSHHFILRQLVKHRVKFTLFSWFYDVTNELTEKEFELLIKHKSGFKHIQTQLMAFLNGTENKI